MLYRRGIARDPPETTHSGEDPVLGGLGSMGRSPGPIPRCFGELDVALGYEDHRSRGRAPHRDVGPGCRPPRRAASPGRGDPRGDRGSPGAGIRCGSGPRRVGRRSDVIRRISPRRGDRKGRAPRARAGRARPEDPGLAAGTAERADAGPDRRAPAAAPRRWESTARIPTRTSLGASRRDAGRNPRPSAGKRNAIGGSGRGSNPRSKTPRWMRSCSTGPAVWSTASTGSRRGRLAVVGPLAARRCGGAASMRSPRPSARLQAPAGRRGGSSVRLPLLAEAQSMLRRALQRLRAPNDPDQLAVYQMVRDAAARHRIFVKRFLRADDPADPAGLAGPARPASSPLAASGQQSRQQKERIDRMREPWRRSAGRGDRPRLASRGRARGRGGRRRGPAQQPGDPRAAPARDRRPAGSRRPAPGLPAGPPRDGPLPGDPDVRPEGGAGLRPARRGEGGRPAARGPERRPDRRHPPPRVAGGHAQGPGAEGPDLDRDQGAPVRRAVRARRRPIGRGAGAAGDPLVESCVRRRPAILRPARQAPGPAAGRIRASTRSPSRSSPRAAGCCGVNESRPRGCAREDGHRIR